MYLIVLGFVDRLSHQPGALTNCFVCLVGDNQMIAMRRHELMAGVFEFDHVNTAVRACGRFMNGLALR
jgi:hypothetical protein